MISQIILAINPSIKTNTNYDFYFNRYTGYHDGIVNNTTHDNWEGEISIDKNMVEYRFMYEHYNVYDVSSSPYPNLSSQMRYFSLTKSIWAIAIMQRTVGNTQDQIDSGTAYRRNINFKFGYKGEDGVIRSLEVDRIRKIPPWMQDSGVRKQSNYHARFYDGRDGNPRENNKATYTNSFNQSGGIDMVSHDFKNICPDWDDNSQWHIENYDNNQDYAGMMILINPLQLRELRDPSSNGINHIYFKWYNTYNSGSQTYDRQMINWNMVFLPYYSFKKEFTNEGDSVDKQYYPMVPRQYKVNETVLSGPKSDHQNRILKKQRVWVSSIHKHNSGWYAGYNDLSNGDIELLDEHKKVFLANSTGENARPLLGLDASGIGYGDYLYYWRNGTVLFENCTDWGSMYSDDQYDRLTLYNTDPSFNHLNYDVEQTDRQYNPNLEIGAYRGQRDVSNNLIRYSVTNGVSGEWVTIDLGRDVILTRFTMELIGYNSRNIWPSDFTIFGSDLSGSNFTKLREIKRLTIFHYMNSPDSGTASTSWKYPLEVDINTNKSFRYYRVVIEKFRYSHYGGSDKMVWY